MVEQNHGKEELLYFKGKGVGLKWGGNSGICLIAECSMTFLSLLVKKLSGRTANSASPDSERVSAEVRADWLFFDDSCLLGRASLEIVHWRLQALSAGQPESFHVLWTVKAELSSRTAPVSQQIISIAFSLTVVRCVLIKSYQVCWPCGITWSLTYKIMLMNMELLLK